ncbi:MAG: hypothetical protein AAGB48_09265 [Planctomycetota bacterium]
MAAEHRTLIQPGDPLVAECANEIWTLRPAKPSEVPNAIALDNPAQANWFPWLESWDQPHEDAHGRPHNCIIFDRYEHLKKDESPTPILQWLALAMVTGLLKAQPSTFTSGFMTESEGIRVQALSASHCNPISTPSGKRYLEWITIPASDSLMGLVVVRSTYGQMIAMADRTKPLLGAESESPSAEDMLGGRYSLTEDMLAVLCALADRPNMSLPQVSIAEAAGIPRSTSGKTLILLRDLKLTTRPHGPKGGDQITTAALSIPEVREHILKSAEHS